MEITAKSKSVRISPRKVRLIAALIRNIPAKRALDDLFWIKKRAAGAVSKTIKSAIANAVHNAKITEDNLIIKRVEVNEGPAFKRFHPSTRGRVHPYKKKSSHLTIILEEINKK